MPPFIAGVPDHDGSIQALVAPDVRAGVGASDRLGVDCREGLASAGFVTTLGVVFLVVCFLIGAFAPR